MSGCDFCEGDEGSALLERARVVGVLDAWAEKHPQFPFITQRGEAEETDRWCCWREGRVNERCYFYGPTPDAARAAAAKAIEAGEV